VVSMNVTAPGVVWSCSFVHMYQHFGRMSCFHLYSCILAQSRNLMEGISELLTVCLLYFNHISMLLCGVSGQEVECGALILMLM
jgi:hypothetical protein